MSRRRQRSDDLKKLLKDTPDSGAANSSSSAPLIHISLPRLPDKHRATNAADDNDDDDVIGGVTNPVFTLGEDDDPPEVATDAQLPPEDAVGRGTPHGALVAPPDDGLAPVETAEGALPVAHPGPATSGDTPDAGHEVLRTSAGSPGISSGGGSHVTLIKSNSLVVPDTTTRRRHSLTVGDQQSLTASFTSEQSASSSQLSPGEETARSNSVTWSEIDQLEKRRGSTGSVSSEDDMGRRMSSLSTSMSERLKDLSRRFAERTERYKEQTERPVTPSTGDSAKSGISAASAASETKEEMEARKRKEDEVARLAAEEKAKLEPVVIPVRYWKNKCCTIRVPLCWERFVYLCGTIDPQSQIYLGWLAFMTFIYLYNCMTCTLRASFRAGKFYVFPYELEEHRQRYIQQAQEEAAANCVNTTYSQNGTVYNASCYFNVSEIVIPPYQARVKLGYETPENRIYWWIIDYFCDSVYLIDILFVRSRKSFINNGLFETSIIKCWNNYRSKPEFKLDMLSVLPFDVFYIFPVLDMNAGVRVNRLFRYDVLSLTPLDLLYFIPQLDYLSLVRLPRILRIHIFWEFFDRLDQVAKSGYIIRIIRTLTYMLFLIHLESCGYYAMSAYEGFGLNDWVYSGQGNAYIRCAYLATKTATSIGNNPRPRNTQEYAFMTVYWLSGVFVFAMLIGQIRDIFQSVTAAETHYRRSMDRAVSYMQGLNVPREMQHKVRSWFNYNWQYQKTLNENSLLDGLPIKMVAELQIAVHFQTLSKVQLFQDCEKKLLYDLVVKLRPSLYLPNDYICKKGEVGTEMYILKQGHVEVVGGENDSLVFATLHEGSVFGEISLLGIQGGNRRTASVRSKGYSNLFVLTKVDFEAAMADYPDAHKLLKKRSMKVLAKNIKKVEDVKKVEVEEIIKQSETPKMVKTVISLLDPASLLRRASLRRQSFISEMGSGSPTESLQGDLDLLSIASDDQILRIEREERPLTAEMEPTLSQHSPPTTPEPAVVITMEELQKEQSEETNHPPDGDTGPSKSSIPNGHLNKVHPAEINVEQEGTEKPKKKKPKSGKLVRSNRIEPVNGVPPGTETQTTNLDAREKSAGNTPAEAEVTSGNVVTCDVEVHREKSPSLTSVRVSGTLNGHVPCREESREGAESPS